MNETLRTRLIGLVVVLVIVFLLTLLIPQLQGDKQQKSAMTVKTIPIGGASVLPAPVLSAHPSLASAPKAESSSSGLGVVHASPEPQATPSPSQSDQVASAPALKSTSRPSAKPAPKVASPSVPTNNRLNLSTVIASSWYVQIASYSDANYARATERKFKKLGIPVGIQIATVKGRVYYRVRLGPYSDQTKAESGKVSAVAHGFKGAQIISP